MRLITYPPHQGDGECPGSSYVARRSSGEGPEKSAGDYRHLGRAAPYHPEGGVGKVNEKPAGSRVQQELSKQQKDHDYSGADIKDEAHDTHG